MNARAEGADAAGQQTLDADPRRARVPATSAPRTRSLRQANKDPAERFVNRRRLARLAVARP
jgi:hypothetical protein